MKNLFWTGYCKNDRISAISKIETIVNTYGYIVDFKMFSDISITINIDIEESKIDKLYTALNTYLSVDKSDELYTDSNRERTIYLNIIFTIGTGDLKIETIAVPG